MSLWWKARALSADRAARWQHVASPSVRQVRHGVRVTLTEEQQKELDEMAKRFEQTKGGSK